MHISIYLHTPTMTEKVHSDYRIKHISILKLVYIHNELLHVSANHVAICSDIKYKVFLI
jgi:hypothetical protein